MNTRRHQAGRAAQAPRKFSLPQLPPMRCDDGCGIVVLSGEEYRRIEKVVGARGVEPVRQGSTCPLFIDGRCSVYEVRPLVCQLYGHVDSPLLTCPKGYNANASADAVAAWNQALHRTTRRSGIRFLHELAFSPEEIRELVESETGGAS